MILRILIFILTAVFFAFVVNGLGQINDELLIEILGQKIAMPTGFAFGSIAVATVIIILMTSFAKDIFALPGKIRARREKAKLERGMTAVARGMEAVAIGDATDATHHAKVAQRTLGQGSITRLLTAQAAQLSGDDEVAGESFEAMLEAPETEFLGLRGLYGKAERNGDKEAARNYAERAYRLRPNAAWAFQAVFDLALERGAWGDARASLGPAQKNKSISPEKAQRAEAALLAASAHAADTSEDVSTALEEAELALKHAPGLAPAAVLAARLHHNGKKTQRGVKILEQAFAAHAHPSLVATLIELTAGANDKASVEALRKLAARNPDTREAQTALARAHILNSAYTDAIDLLEPLLETSASASDCALMAEAMAGAHGEPAARPWLQRAASAVRDASPGADGRFRFTKEGWAQLIRLYMEEEKLGPDPIEGPPIGLEASEIRLLTAPIKVETKADDEAGQEDAPVNASASGVDDAGDAPSTDAKAKDATDSGDEGSPAATEPSAEPRSGDETNKTAKSDTQTTQADQQTASDEKADPEKHPQEASDTNDEDAASALSESDLGLENADDPVLANKDSAEEAASKPTTG